MNIRCPQCGFTKDVSASRLPASKVIATCPKCNFRFTINGNNKNQVAAEPEEEDIRVVASRAYKREAERFEREAAAKNTDSPEKTGPIPWEMAPEKIGWPAAFYQTALQVMFSAPRFFSHLKPNAPMGRALAFFLIIIAIQIMLERIWGYYFLSFIKTGVNNDPELKKMLTMLAPETNIVLGFLLRGAMFVLQLYVFTFLIFISYKLIAPAKATFPLLFQIMAYSTAPALLCIVPVIGTIIGLFWSIGCLLAGCKAALKLDWPRVIIAMLPIIALVAPIYIQALKMISQGSM